MKRKSFNLIPALTTPAALALVALAWLAPAARWA